MTMWLDQLELAPDAISSRQRRFVVFASVIVALTRLFAVSKSLWDWDEALFSHALLDYDVVHHHPHPPGFPLFIFFARLLRPLASSDFRAIQFVVVAGAMLLFPVMMFLGRELRLPLPTATVAAFLLAFFPNVWFFGGTAFSDVPSLTLVVLACALLLRGCRSFRSLVLGAFVLAIAAGFRPQNLLVGCFPALIACWFRLRATRSLRQPLLGMLVGAATLAAAYGGAALATDDWRQYLEAVRYHSAYIEKVDSYRNPLRPTLQYMFDDFFIRPFRMWQINAAVSLLVAIGAVAGFVRRRPPVMIAFMAFGPFCLLGWLMLDRHSTSRFSIGWAPLIAICAAEGIEWLSRWIAFLTHRPRGRMIARGVLTAALILLMISWTFPALKVVRRKTSPPMQAIAWIRGNIPAGSHIYFESAVEPFANLMLKGDYRLEKFEGDAPDVPGQPGWVFREGVSSHPLAQNFSYRRGTLWDLARRRYFEVSVGPLDASVRFESGWYDAESSDTHTFRWMAHSGTLLLGSTETPGVIALRGYVPLDALDSRPEIAVTLNGTTLQRFVVTKEIVEHDFHVGPMLAPRNEVRIETDRTVNPRKKGLGNDPRDLGFRLDSISWRSEETER